MLQSLWRDGLALRRWPMIDPLIRIGEMRGVIWRHLDIRIRPRLKGGCRWTLLCVRGEGGGHFETIWAEGEGLIVGSVYSVVVRCAIRGVLQRAMAPVLGRLIESVDGVLAIGGVSSRVPDVIEGVFIVGSEVTKLIGRGSMERIIGAKRLRVIVIVITGALMLRIHFLEIGTRVP